VVVFTAAVGLLKDCDFTTSLRMPKGEMSPRGIFQSPLLYISIAVLFFFMLALVFMVPHGKLGYFSAGWLS